MKIPTPGRKTTQHGCVIFQVMGNHMDHLAFSLNQTLYAEQLCTHERLVLLFCQALPDHQIDIASFILERHKGHIVGA